MSNLILNIKEREEELREKEEVLNNLTDGLAKFNEKVKSNSKQEFTQTEMRNLMKKYSGVFYNNVWADGELIITETNCLAIIKPSRIETRIVRKNDSYFVDGKFVCVDRTIENRYFYNINDLKTILENKVENARMSLECAKQNAFEEMKELQKYFSKNGSPDGNK